MTDARWVLGGSVHGRFCSAGFAGLHVLTYGLILLLVVGLHLPSAPLVIAVVAAACVVAVLAIGFPEYAFLRVFAVVFVIFLTIYGAMALVARIMGSKGAAG